MAAVTKTPTSECDNHHDDYYERRSVPRIRLLVISILGAGMGTAAAVLFFIISAKITEHELRDKEVMVTRREFEVSIERIEHRFDKLEDSVISSLDDLGQKVERNHNAIVGRNRP